MQSLKQFQCYYKHVFLNEKGVMKKPLQSMTDTKFSCYWEKLG